MTHSNQYLWIFLENNEVIMSRLVVNKSEFYQRNSLATLKESLTLYLLNVKSLSMGTKNLAILYTDVPIATRVG